MRAKQVLKDNGLIIQQDSYTCGPVSLLNVLRLKGDKSYNETELAELCNAKPGIGTSNENLLAAAKQINLDIVETKADGTINDIERLVDQNNYVIVNYMHLYSGEGHYAVLTDYDDEALYFVDPSYGYFRVKKQYFERYWYSTDKTIYGWYLALS